MPIVEYSVGSTIDYSANHPLPFMNGLHRSPTAGPLPAQVAVRTQHLQNTIIQLRRGERFVSVSATSWARRSVTGAIAEQENGDGAILLVPRDITPPEHLRQHSGRSA
jgi:hypothetical protein